MSDEGSGVLGKLKAIKDYLDTNLSATRAAKLDNLTGHVALASTALSNATWTSARAAKLDNLDKALSDVAVETPLDQFIFGICYGMDLKVFPPELPDVASVYESDDTQFWDEPIRDGTAAYSGISAANTWKTLLDVTSGSGRFFGVIGPHAKNNTTSRTLDYRITIDGVSKTFSDTYTPSDSTFGRWDPFLLAAIYPHYEADYLAWGNTGGGTFESGPIAMTTRKFGNNFTPPTPHIMRALGLGKIYTSSIKVEVRCSIRDTTEHGDRAMVLYWPDNYGGA